MFGDDTPKPSIRLRNTSKAETIDSSTFLFNTDFTSSSDLLKSISSEIKLSELDVRYMQALESADTSQQASVVSEKNALRDFPSTITNDSFSTIDELRALWPTSSLDLPIRW